MKKLLLVLFLISIITLIGYSDLSGTYTTNKFFYLPGYGSYGTDEFAEYNTYMQKADTQIKSNQTEARTNKWDATSAPGVTNDIDEGYIVGSTWLDVTNDKAYVCLDNTDGAAVWTETTGAGGGSGTVTTSGTPVANDIARFTGATVIEGLSYSEFKVALDLEIGTDVLAQQSIGITDNYLLEVDGSPNSAEYARFTANGLEGRTEAEFKGDFNLEIGTDVQAFDDALTSVSGLTYVSPSFIKLTADDTYAVRTFAEVKTDLTLNNVTNVATSDTAYDATSWNANSDAATKNAIRDKIETIGGYTNLTSFVEQTAWRVFYSNTDGDVVELALGDDGSYLGSNGASVAPTWSVPAGAGDVSKVGTPADSQVGVWTGDGTIEGAATLTYDGANLQLTGDIGSTGTKITKGWFTDLTVTNAIVGSVTGNAATVTSFTPASGSLTLAGADALTLTTTAATNVTLPTTGTLLANTVEDTSPELGGEMDAGAHSIGFTQQTVSYNSATTTVDWKLSNKASMTFGAGNITTFAFTNPTNPCNVLLMLIQDGTGSRIITNWDADILWAGGNKPTLTTTASAVDIATFYWNGTKYYGVASLDFK